MNENLNGQYRLILRRDIKVAGVVSHQATLSEDVAEIVSILSGGWSGPQHSATIHIRIGDMTLYLQPLQAAITEAAQRLFESYIDQRQTSLDQLNERAVQALEKIATSLSL